MREIIWYDFVHYRHGDDYLVAYIKKLKDTRKLTNILTILFSTSGLLSWKIWQFFPVITSGLIAVIQLFKTIENQFIPSDKDIEQTIILREKYCAYWNAAEKLWIEYNSNKLNEDQAQKEFFKLRKSAFEIESLDNKLNIQRISKLQDKADIETNNYLNQYHIKTN